MSSMFGLLVPWMIRDAIDGLAAGAGEARLVRSVSWMLAFAALHGAFRYVARRWLLVTARRVEQALRRDTFAHVVRLPLSFFGRTATGDVMSRLTNDVSAVWLLLGPGMLTLIGTAISYALALAFMARISVLLTAVALALAPVIVVLSREYGKAFHRLHRRVQESLARMNALLQEDIAGIRLVKTYGLEEREGGRFREICTEYYRHNVSVSRTSASFHGGIGFLAGTGVALVLLLGGWLVIRGRLTLGGFVAFNAYLAMLSFPTMALGWVINLVQRGGSAMGRINEFLRHPPELSTREVEPTVADGESPGRGASHEAAREGAEPVAPDACAETPGASDPDAPLLEIRGLSFSYEGAGRGEALCDVSFSIRKGEVVGLVGQTGSGKSTLLSLVLRLYPVPEGTVFLEGRDVTGIPLTELRRSVNLVGQDPFLFSDTVLENICFAADAPDEAAARQAATLARFLDEIDGMPHGLATVIGERGVTLSGGQKQRATIARALCAGGALLMLDDVLSAVDSETEREIFDRILAAREGRTVLFATHRLGSLTRCDRVLVMREGRIVEQGTHEELFALGGEYFDLYSRQMIARELEASP